MSGVQLSIQSDFSIMSDSVVYPIRFQHYVWFRCLSNQISALCLVSLSIQSDFSIMYGLYCTVLLEHPAYNVRIIWCNDFGFGWNNWWWYVNLKPFLPPPHSSHLVYPHSQRGCQRNVLNFGHFLVCLCIERYSWIKRRYRFNSKYAFLSSG